MTSMDNGAETVGLAVELTIAWLSNPNTRSDGSDVPAFLNTMHETLVRIGDADGDPVAPAAETPAYKPAVSVRKSLASDEVIVSMIDGKPYKTLRRHLAGHGLTPDEYRARYGLKADYPMTAPSYSEARRTMAKKIGLGRKPGTTVTKSTAPQPVRRKLGVATPA